MDVDKNVVVGMPKTTNIIYCLIPSCQRLLIRLPPSNACTSGGTRQNPQGKGKRLTGKYIESWCFGKVVSCDLRSAAQRIRSHEKSQHELSALQNFNGYLCVKDWDENKAMSQAII